MRHALICLVAASGLLSACTTHDTAEALRLPYLPLTALAAADGVSFLTTQKTVEDHVIGWVTHQECSLLRASHGEDYCVSKDPPPKVAVVSYCYHTLAKTTCYDRKIPSDIGTYSGSRLDMVPVATIRRDS